jgi:hypothetical protein
MAEKKGTRDVQWQTPQTRNMPIWEHAVTCAFCGREFVVELTTPIPPLYCLKADNPDCHQQRKAAYMKEYRAKKRGDTAEG